MFSKTSILINEWAVKYGIKGWFCIACLASASLCIQQETTNFILKLSFQADFPSYSVYSPSFVRELVWKDVIRCLYEMCGMVTSGEPVD